MKPFIKWAGGKNFVLASLQNFFPSKQNNFNYAEPFLGGGAMFFYLANNFNLQKIVLNDVSPKLIATYLAVQKYCKQLVVLLNNLQQQYWQSNQEQQKALFYQWREAFNNISFSCPLSLNKSTILEVSSLFIALNKTCFNGLFRTNKQNAFNSPFGYHLKPTIIDEHNLQKCSQALQKASITCQDFSETLNNLTDNFFIYLDPPYKPISKTSSFNSYFGDFNDQSQQKLALLLQQISHQHHILLSNSDDGTDFFTNLYSDFFINKIAVARSINSKGKARGKISELVISNYNNFLQNEQQSLEFNF